MDGAGVDVQILSIAPPGTHVLPAREAVALSREANGRASEAIDRYPTRLRATTTLPMSDPDAAVPSFIVRGTCDRHPDLQIVLGHWGEMLLFALLQIERSTNVTAGVVVSSSDQTELAPARDSALRVMFVLSRCRPIGLLIFTATLTLALPDLLVGDVGLWWAHGRGASPKDSTKAISSAATAPNL